ncbi:hypothetical protein [Arthrobacter sp. UYCu712]|uniref:hypothetical protein n=1 Tax=Arthrobacter sp. UYCu712 TaxID=3156340 RepID=UPI0033919950
MAPASRFPSRRNAPPGGSTRPWCSACGTDAYLFIETVGGSANRPGTSIEVSYTCLECDTFHAHDVLSGCIDPSILRQFPPEAPDNEHGTYLHCGEPMTAGTTAGRSLTTTVPAGQSRRNHLEAYLHTQVLHCRCGFRMEIPHADRP